MSWCSCMRGWALQVCACMCVPECARLPQSTLCPGVFVTQMHFSLCASVCACVPGGMWSGCVSTAVRMCVSLPGTSLRHPYVCRSFGLGARTGPACPWHSWVPPCLLLPGPAAASRTWRTRLNCLELSPGLGSLRVTVGRPDSALLLAARGAQDAPGDRPRPALGTFLLSPHPQA